MKHLVSRPTSTSTLLRMLNSILFALLIAFSLTSNKSAYSRTITLLDDKATEDDAVMAVDSSGDECQSDVDLHTWIQEGEVANGDWQVTVDPATGIGRSVYQTINHDPTFFVSPDNYMNVRIRGSMRVEDDWDNDFIGFVFGYNGPTRSRDIEDYDFLLFDWKKETQRQEGRNGMEGKALAKVKGDLTGFENMYDYFWQHNNRAGKFNMEAQDWGANKGWEYDTDYDFELVYTSTLVSITINDELVFSKTGCFKSGRFGFYNFSQQSVRYSDFSYTLETNFEVGGDVCLGTPTDFMFADTCFGVDNTTANLRRWEWDFGDGNTSTEVNPSHTYAAAGTYRVKLFVEDKNGCTDEVVKLVTVIPSVTIADLPDTTLCRGQVYSVDVTDPIATSYRWQDGSHNPVYEISTPGTYWIETTNGACRYRESFEVRYENPLRNFNLGPDRELCVGETLGLDATLQGAASYTWDLPSSDQTLWNEIVTTPTLTADRAGTYSVEVANACGTRTDHITISYITPPVVSVEPIESLCYGESINLNASVENSDVETTLAWAPGGATTSSIRVTPTQSTTYTISATNICGTTTATQAVNVIPAIDLQMTATDVNCAGADDGQVMVTASGGSGNFSYDWLPNVGSSASLSQLAPGSYTVKVLDDHGCHSEETITISEPTELESSILNQEDVSCFGENNGSLTLQASGGVAGYSYSLDGANFVNSPTFNNLPAGNYAIVVKDQNDCITNVDAQITQPTSALNAAIADHKDVNCFDGNDGELTLAANGGTSPYRYALGGQSYGNSPSFNNLSEGTYTLYIKDANDCVTSLEEAITQPQLLTAATSIQNEILCYGLNDGAATVAVEGGVSPYTYVWSGNAGNTETANSLSAGTYSVSITDNNGCTVESEVVLTQPEALTAGIESAMNIYCYGEATGRINLRAQGGTAGYSYSIDGANFVSLPVFSNLTAGSYAVVVKDQNDCEATLNAELTQPEMPMVALMADKKDVDCFGMDNGLLLAETNGGTAPYTYSLNGQAFSSNSRFEGLVAGNYSIQIKDANNCFETLNATISQPETLEALASIQKEIACYGESNGEAIVNVTGGTTPYSYNWGGRGTTQTLSDLTAGTYTVRVTDANGCESLSGVTFAAPSEIVATLDQVQNVQCFGDKNGLAKVSVTGGSAPYQYEWNTTPVQRSHLVAGLGAGTYAVTIIDRHGCETTLDDILVSQPEEILLSTAHTDVKCFGDNTGTASVAIAGGTAPFSTIWNGDQGLSATELSDLNAGTHTVKVVDAHGCEMEANVVINQPDEISLELAELSNAYCSLPNGSALINVKGGNGNLSYTWSGISEKSPLAANLKAGPYKVTATDEKGCSATMDVMITNTPPPIAKFTHNHFDRDSVQMRHARFDFRNVSVGAVQYAWDFGDGSPIATSEHPSHAYADTGTYNVVLTAYDAFNTCPSTDSMVLRIFHGGKIFTPNAFSPNGDGVNDAWFVKGEGITTMELIIFDRWGKELDRITSLEDGWDGRSNKGNAVQEGVYVYLLNAVLNTGAKVKRGGTITLIR